MATRALTALLALLLLCAAFENQHYQYRQGILDEATFLGYERAIAEQTLAFPGFRLWWEQTRGVFSPAFVEHVDALIAHTPPIEPDHFFQQWRGLPRDGSAGDG